MKLRPARAALRFVLDVVRHSSRHNVPRAAAALTYYFVLSVFPLLICINACVGLLHVDVKALLESLDRLFPPQALSLAEDYVDYLSQTPSSALLPTGIVALLLSASAGVRVLLSAMDEFFGRHRNTGARRTVLSVLFSVLLLAVLYLSVAVVFAGGWFFGLIHQHLPPELEQYVKLSRIAGLWLNLRYLLLFCFILLLVLILYRLGMPRRRVSTRAVLVCALFSAAALVVASIAFSWFISMSTRYSLLYGSLASIVILLLWLYLCGTILLLGALVGAVWVKRHPRRPKLPPGDGEPELLIP